MRALIVTIGDEILIGQTIDTNSAWLASQLHLVGISIDRIISIHDTEEDILEALELGFSTFELIIITGGLGPTKDDITKVTLAKYFGVSLEFRQEVMDKVQSHFDRLGYKMPETNKNQALLPANCKHYLNEQGTAPGMWFEHHGKLAISLPGVPYEMKGLMQNGILKDIKSFFNAPNIYHETLMTQGIGESSIMQIIENEEDALRTEGLSLAYLPSPGQVKLRISGYERAVKNVHQRLAYYKQAIAAKLPQYIYGYNGQTIEQVVQQLMIDQKWTVATAESCTGGYIAHLITSQPGSSAYFNGSVVAYSNQIKQSILDVNPADIEIFGAVSQPVVEQMAEQAMRKLNADFGVATSGIAGPDGGSELKPVGTVWIAVASASGVVSKRFFFGNHRERTILKATLTALNMLRKKAIEDMG